MSGLAQPTISQQPSNLSASLGANAPFQVTASGTKPFSYQWRFNDLEIFNATNRSLTITNIQLTNAGFYSVVVTNFSGIHNQRVRYPRRRSHLYEDYHGRIVTDLQTGLGCAWGDYDNDGYLDLIVVNAFDGVTGLPLKATLFYNNRNGTFGVITSTAITADTMDWRGCAWADYDNDGNLDLYMTSTDAYGFAAQNELFRNSGDGTFTKMTAPAVGSIVGPGGGSEGATWLTTTMTACSMRSLPAMGVDRLYHQNSNGVFASVASTVTGPAHDDSYLAAWGDYNNDGRPDLFVSVKSDPPTNRLYLNLGNGSFTQVKSGSIATDSAHSVGCAWGDYDNDGYLDLIVANGSYVTTEPNFLLPQPR